MSGKKEIDAAGDRPKLRDVPVEIPKACTKEAMHKAKNTSGTSGDGPDSDAFVNKDSGKLIKDIHAAPSKDSKKDKSDRLAKAKNELKDEISSNRGASKAGKHRDVKAVEKAEKSSSEITVSKKTPRKPNSDQEKSEPLREHADNEEKPEDKTPNAKQERFVKYMQWQNRGGPKAPGSKEIPTVS